MDDATPPYRDAWDITHPGESHAPTVGLYDKTPWPDPPFTFGFIFVSQDLAPRVREMRVDPTSNASDHQPVLLALPESRIRVFSDWEKENCVLINLQHRPRSCQRAFEQTLEIASMASICWFF